MSKNSITIDGVEYTKKENTDENPICIVVLQRGFCLVGRLKRNGSDCELFDSSVIRRWGTTQGLGQIAKDGPTEDTILDPCNGVVKFDYLTVVFTIDCVKDNWVSYLT